jgi:hypothetical protein
MLLGLYRMRAPSYQLMQETAYNNLSGTIDPLRLNHLAMHGQTRPGYGWISF